LDVGNYLANDFEEEKKFQPSAIELFENQNLYFAGYDIEKEVGQNIFRTALDFQKCV
jgi:hypothetical protein